MPEWMLQTAGMLFAGGVIYGAIKQDLRAMHEHIIDNKRSSERAHVRIDEHIDKHHVAALTR
jgi:hypothetical protein